MDPTVAIVGFVAVLAILAALFFAYKANAAASSLPQGNTISTPAVTAGKGIVELEKKLADVRAELTSARDEVQRKAKQLEEAREQARLKAKREGKKAEEQKTDGKADPRDVEIQSLRKGMAALESQLNAIKRDAAQQDQSAAERAERTSASVAEAEKRAAAEKERRATLEREAGDLRKTIDELRATIKKADARPDIPGSALNLKELPPPVVQELARYFRKGEEFERLYTVAQSQLQLEKDRAVELSRRYFAVCRELAVQAGLPATATAADVQKTADAVLAAAEAGTRPAPRRDKDKDPAPAAAAGEGGADVAAAADGEVKKKRRRRRKRKIAGESSLEEAADGSEDGDDGESDDEEHGASEADVSAADATASKPAEAADAATDSPASA
jgi:colicin import membrane protein